MSEKEENIAPKENEEAPKEIPNEIPESSEVIPEEVLEAIPEEDRGRVASIIKQTMISGVMRRSNPIADKITPDHITQLITNSDNQDTRDRDERKGNKWFQILLIVIVLAFIGFLVIQI